MLRLFALDPICIWRQSIGCLRQAGVLLPRTELRSTSYADTTGTTYYCGARRRHAGAGAFLVSISLLRQYGLLPGRLRSVGGDGFRLALHPDRQSVQT